MLFLIRPRTRSNVSLNTQHPVLMDERVRLSYQAHYFVPGTFYMRGGWLVFFFNVIRKRVSFCCDQSLCSIIPLERTLALALARFPYNRKILFHKTRSNRHDPRLVKLTSKFRDSESTYFRNCRTSRKRSRTNSSTSRMHTIAQPTSLHQSLHGSDFFRYRSGRSSDLWLLA